MKTTGDRVVIKIVEEKIEKSGIELPGYRHEAQKGIVIARGPDCKTVEEGKKVLYSKNAGATIDINGELHIIMRESDIFVQL